MVTTMSLRAPLTVQSTILCLSRIAFELGFPCEDIPDRVFYADAVVFGRTISEERVPTRPEMSAVIHQFRVEEVLKGSLYKTGDILTYSFDQMVQRGLDGPPLPSPEDGPHFAFVNQTNSKTWISCPATPEKTSTAKLRRIAAGFYLPFAR